VSLSEMIRSVGEETVKGYLANFSCPLNHDVEMFLKTKAVEFSRQGIAQTKLIFMSHRGEPTLVGYYALANKFIVIPRTKINAKTSKRLSRFSPLNPETGTYSLPMILIAQLSKNYLAGINDLISGSVILKLACDSVAEVQRVVGGKFVYLECENTPKLIAFYKDSGFCEFGERELDKDEVGLMKTNKLMQMLKYL